MSKFCWSLVAALGLSLVAVSAENVKVNFNTKCAGCHGKTGKGDTKMGQKLGVRDYTDAKVQAKVKDEEMFKAIKEGLKKDGKVAMKPYGDKLTEEEIKALVVYFRALKK